MTAARNAGPARIHAGIEPATAGYECIEGAYDRPMIAPSLD